MGFMEEGHSGIPKVTKASTPLWQAIRKDVSSPATLVFKDNTLEWWGFTERQVS